MENRAGVGTPQRPPDGISVLVIGNEGGDRTRAVLGVVHPGVGRLRIRRMAQGITHRHSPQQYGDERKSQRRKPGIPIRESPRTPTTRKAGRRSHEVQITLSWVPCRPVSRPAIQDSSTLVAGNRIEAVKCQGRGMIGERKRMSNMDTPSHVRGEGVTTLPRRPREETARLGDEIYERDIRPRVEADHHGEFVSIDVASGSWAVSDDLLTAAKRLRNNAPAPSTYGRCRLGMA